MIATGDATDTVLGQTRDMKKDSGLSDENAAIVGGVVGGVGGAALLAALAAGIMSARKKKAAGASSAGFSSKLNPPEFDNLAKSGGAQEKAMGLTSA
jgi:hypothetical protein